MTGESTPQTGGLEGDAPTGASPTARVLVVDDSPVDRRMAGRILQRQGGFDISYAADGAEALESLASGTPPDAIVTDLQMPILDGLSLVEEVRRRFPLVPTILMTAHGSEETALKALERGAASYVPKRNLARDLVDTVKNVVALAQAGKQQRRLQQYWTQTEFRFCLENDTALIPLLVSYVQQYLRSAADCDETELIRMGVALHEALTNAIHHGNLELDSSLREDGAEAYFLLAEQRRQSAPYRERRVEVVVSESPLEGRYVIRDQGRGFDPAASWVDPTDPANLERPSGRGLFLIRTFMHEVRHNDRGNEITLVHRRDCETGGHEGWQSRQCKPDKTC